MKELLIAIIITAVVFLISYFAGPTGYATYTMNKLTVSGGHALLTQTFSPNGDGVADIVYTSSSGKCAKGYAAGIGIYDSSDSIITGQVSNNLCLTNGCDYSGSTSWNGKDPSSGNYVSDGTYTVRSGCWQGGTDASVISKDKIVTITLNKKLYPSSINYNGVACGTKPTCNLQTGFGGWGTGCGKTTTQNAMAWCNSKDDTCVKSDTGSCKKNYGWAGNVVSCDAVSGTGVCQAKTTIPGK